MPKKQTKRGTAPAAKKRGGTAPWTLGLAWLSSFLMVVLAVLLALLTTLLSPGYVKGRVDACGYADAAYVEMRETLVSYGAGAGFSEETMTAVLDRAQIAQDMKASIDGLYAESPYSYNRPAVAEQAYAAMEAEAAQRGITLEGETIDNVKLVAEAVRQVYAGATSVPLVTLLHGALQKLRTVVGVGLPVCGVFLAMALILMLRISRYDARLGARSLAYALGGAGLVNLVLGLAVEPTLGLERLSLEPLAVKELLLGCVHGLFGRFLLAAAVCLLLAAAIALLLRPRRGKGKE